MEYSEYDELIQETVGSSTAIRLFAWGARVVVLGLALSGICIALAYFGISRAFAIPAFITGFSAAGVGFIVALIGAIALISDFPELRAAPDRAVGFLLDRVFGRRARPSR